MTSAGSVPGNTESSPVCPAIIGIAHASAIAPNAMAFWQQFLSSGANGSYSNVIAERAHLDLESVLSSVVNAAFNDAGLDLRGLNAPIAFKVCSSLEPEKLSAAASVMGFTEALCIPEYYNCVSAFLPDWFATKPELALVVAVDRDDNGFAAFAFLMHRSDVLIPGGRAYCTIAGANAVSDCNADQLKSVGLLYVLSAKDSYEFSKQSLPQYKALVAGDCSVDSRFSTGPEAMFESTALTKAALSLYHRTLPPVTIETAEVPKPSDPSVKARAWIHPRVHPKLDQYTSASSDFKRACARYAAVISSSVSFDQSLQPTAILLREFDDVWEAQRPSLMPDWESEVCVVAAATFSQLCDRIEQLQQFLSENPHVLLKDVAFSLSRQKARGQVCLSIVAGSNIELLEKCLVARQALAAPGVHALPPGIYLPSDPYICQGKTAFILPGLGAAYPNMLADLALHFPDVRASFDFVDALASSAGDKIRPSQLIFGSSSNQATTLSTALLASMDSAVVTVLLAEWSLFEVLSNLGVKPDMLIGCSTGEFAALTISGAADIVLAAPMFYRLSTKMARSIPKNSLADLRSLKINANYRDISPMLAGLPDVYLSADLSPVQHLISGSKQSISEVSKRLDAANVEFHPLPMAIPYHTPLVSGVIDKDNPEVAALPLVAPQIQTWSCSTASVYPSDVEYVRRITTELFSHSILFQQTVESAYSCGATKFVEVGPKNTLTAIVSEVLSGYPHLAVASNAAGRSALTQLNHLIAALAAANVDMNLDYLFARRLPNLFNIFQDGLSAAPIFLDSINALDFGSLAESLVGQSYSTDSTNAADSTDSTEKILSNYLAGLAEFHTQLMNVQAEVMTAFLNKQSNMSDDFANQIADQPELTRLATELCNQSLSAVGTLTQEYEGAQQDSVQVMAKDNLAALPQRSGNPDHAHLKAMPPKAGASARATELINRMFASIPMQSGRSELGQFPFVHRGIVTSDCEPKCVDLIVSLNPNDDRYLLDHAIGGLIRPLVGERVYLLPLMVALEIMAETAKILLPELKLVKFADVSAARRIRVPHEGCVVRARAELIGESTVKVSLTVLGARAAVESNQSRNGSEERADSNVAMSCWIHFADEYPKAPPSPAQPQGCRPPKLSSERIYGQHSLFHGPSMRSVRATESVGERSLTAAVDIRPADGWFSLSSSPANSSTHSWICDPLLLDNATQTVLLFLIEQGTKPQALLPFFADSIEFYADIPRKQMATVSATIHRANASGTESDITIVCSGQTIAKFQRLAHKAITLSDRWRQCIEDPTGTYLSESLNVLDGLNNVAVCMATGADLSPDDATVSWCADYVLSDNEARVFSNLPNWRRRREWLLGRIAVKDAVRKLSASRFFRPPSPAEIEIEHLENGQPVVSLTTAGRIGFAPKISISHKDGIAVALASAASDVHAVGVDIETVSPRDDGFLRLAFSESEQAYLANIAPESRDSAAITFWSAKEAVGKALGIGMSNNPKSLELELGNPRFLPADPVVVKQSGALGNAKFIVHSLVKPDYVITMTLLEQAQ